MKKKKTTQSKSKYDGRTRPMKRLGFKKHMMSEYERATTTN